jgi:predicted phage terminase large subunit-like protein
MSLTLPLNARVLTQKTATKPQNEFWNNPALFRMFVGGRGSGKTHAGAIEALRMPPGSVGMIIAPTNQMLRDGALRTVQTIANQAGIIQDYNQTYGEMRLLGDRVIKFRSADAPDRLRGANLGWLWLDEAALMNPETWSIVIATLREQPGKAWITTTPRGRNWIYELWTTGGEDYAMIESRTADNIYLHDSFVEILRRTYTAEQYAQESEGKFVDAAGALFKRDWFQYVEYIDNAERLDWYRYYDLAASVKQAADYTASAKCAFGDDGTLYIADVTRHKGEWPDIRRQIMQRAQDEPRVVIGIEESLHGLAGLQELRREPAMANITFHGVVARGDKRARAMPWAARAEQKKLALLRGDWNRIFLDECVSFPIGAHDDMIDAVSGAVHMIGARSMQWGYF